jgi:hypothetical protein
LKALELQMKLPETSEECELAASVLRSISYKEAIPNCVDMLDGHLLRINMPRKREALNVRFYYYGHYQCSGINIKAVADHLCQFMHFDVSAA